MIYKCKKCGGAMDVAEKSSVAKCPYCKAIQTFPLIDDEKKARLFNRANDLLRECDFDRAGTVYEKLIEEGCDDSEAYWGLVLCKFGIEYVNDSATGDMIPTCHWAVNESITADPDFKNACARADAYRQQFYIDQARKIAEKQEKILQLIRDEKPYDVFISFKQSDKNGQQTKDYMRAQGLYDALKEKGLRVFFSPVSLPKHPGEDFEPFIFAALSSAKVMMVVGSSRENIDSAWVRNEWKRFIKMYNNDNTRTIIMCIFDMSPNDLPDGLTHKQIVDINNANNLISLVEKVKSIIDKSKPKPVYEIKPKPITPVVTGYSSVPKTDTTTQNSATVDSMLKRTFQLLSAGEFIKADQHCETILDINPECAEAHLGKLMAELKVRWKVGLKDEKKPLDNSQNYWNAIRYDSSIAAELEEDNKIIRERNETERKDSIYSEATDLMTGNNISNYENALKKFESIIDWKDSRDKIDICRRTIEDLHIRKEKAEADRKHREEEERATKERIEIEQREREAKKKRKKAIFSAAQIAICAAVIVIHIIILLVTEFGVGGGGHSYNASTILLYLTYWLLPVYICNIVGIIKTDTDASVWCSIIGFLYIIPFEILFHSVTDGDTFKFMFWVILVCISVITGVFAFIIRPIFRK